jgi:hypothetical protein
MPLSLFQKQVFALLKANRNPDSYIAGGTAIHQSEQSLRFSQDIDLFHDSDEAVISSFKKDKKVLTENSYTFKELISEPSFYRALIQKGKDSLKLEWVRDTAFRFFPVIEDSELGFRLHPVDLAVNKCLALANRTEVRDLIDMVELHQTTLSLSACCWAACGKDPGFTPGLILEMLQRHSIVTPELLAAESLTKPIDPILLKKEILHLLNQAKAELKKYNPKELGCIYVDASGAPLKEPLLMSAKKMRPHFGSVRGSWPRVIDT